MIEGNLLVGGLILGLVAGVMGGLFGIGGGLVMVPAMIVIFQFSTKTATGTSLMAQVLPVGILGAIQYYRAGNVRVGFGMSMALGLLVGILAGAMVAGQVSGPVMKRLYGVFLLACGGYFLLAPSGVKERPQVRPVAVEGAGTPASGGADQEVH